MVVVLLAVATAFGVQAQTEKGAVRMTLFGGSRGPVPFTHGEHQERLRDCQVCHSFFAQEKGSIEKLKSSNGLKKKQVMNTLCIKCHKAEKRAGKAAGPITCGQCHVRE
jgi:hypothetical protein